jgi:hypothetical protein
LRLAGADVFEGPTMEALSGDYDFDTANTESEYHFPWQEDSESDTDLSEHGNDEDGDMDNVKFEYRPMTWSRNHASYEPEPGPFIKEAIGLTGQYDAVPSYMQLFEKIWTTNMLRNICIETNRYAGSLDEQGIEGVHGMRFVHGYEKTSKQESILGEIREGFLLPHHCGIIYTETVHGIDAMSPHNQSLHLC